MKRGISFCILLSILVSSIFTCAQEEFYHNVSLTQHDDKREDDPISRVIKEHPLLAAALVIVPIFFLSYTLKKAIEMNAELTQCTAACIEREQNLEIELLEVQSKLEEREEFIRTTFKDVNEKLHLLTFMKPLGADK